MGLLLFLLFGLSPAMLRIVIRPDVQLVGRTGISTPGGGVSSMAAAEASASMPWLVYSEETRRIYADHAGQIRLCDAHVPKFFQEVFQTFSGLGNDRGPTIIARPSAALMSDRVDHVRQRQIMCSI